MAISSVVSTFELLVKPLVQPSADILGAGRTIIQGYFLTISNLNTNSPVQLRINFRAQDPNLNSQPLLAFFDVNGANNLLAPSSSTPTTQTYTVSLGAGDTGLFLLQPDVSQGTVVQNANVELRGYVTLSLAFPFGSNSFNLLITPQQRGTFLPKGFQVPNRPPAPNATTREDFDQLAYSLPTADGKAQVNLSQIQFPILNPPRLLPELIDLDPGLAQIIRDNSTLVNGNLERTIPNLRNAEGLNSAQSESLQQVLSSMFERIDGLEQQLSNGRATQTASV
jgi:hypothetical protein